MRLSRKTEYGLRALAHMARGKKNSWSIQELSETERIPVKFLEQILLTLRHSGLLTSRRGMMGGYSLARAASEITMGEVIRALEGPLAPVPCAMERPTEKCSCPDPATCPVRQMMTAFRQDTMAWLDGRSLEDLARLSPGQGALAFEI
jgi:Rrf2 family cysteine metabolism transcriptional repressor